jgi:hypothetical protein
MNGVRRLQNFVNSTGKLNSIVVKTLKLVLCSSRDGVLLKFKKHTWRQYSSSLRIVWAWFFRPLLNLAEHYLSRHIYVRFPTSVFFFIKRIHLRPLTILYRKFASNIKPTLQRYSNRTLFLCLHCEPGITVFVWGASEVKKYTKILKNTV